VLQNIDRRSGDRDNP